MAGFAYLRSMGFAFYGSCKGIIKVLMEKRWKVKGIDLEFDGFDTDEGRKHYVKVIRGDDFRIWIDKPPDRHKTVPNVRITHILTTEVRDIVIPGIKIYIDQDRIVTLYLYVGQDWQADKAGFMSDIFPDHTVKGKYLTYHTSLPNPSYAVDYLEDFMDAVTDQRLVFREDESDPDELPKDFQRGYNGDQVFKEIDNWLRENVLKKILKHPVVSA